MLTGVRQTRDRRLGQLFGRKRAGTGVGMPGLAATFPAGGFLGALGLPAVEGILRRRRRGVGRVASAAFAFCLELLALVVESPTQMGDLLM